MMSGSRAGESGVDPVNEAVAADEDRRGEGHHSGEVGQRG
jgi:hypothetical protein